MNRTVTPVSIGQSKTRYTLRLTSDFGAEGMDKRNALQALFGAILHDPRLLHCGPVLPDKISIFHDGQFWQLVAEADDQPLNPHQET